MVTTVSPNPIYRSDRASGEGFGVHGDKARDVKLFKGEYIDSVCSDMDDLYLFYIKTGQIKCTFSRGSVEGRVLFMRGEGSAFINENEKAVRRVGSVRYVARHDTVLAAFSKQQVFELVSSDRRLFDELLAIEHRAFVQLGYRASLLDIQSSSERILTWLSDLCEGQRQQPDGSYEIPCNLTLEGMSDFLHVHITTLSRLLASLKQDGILERGKKVLIIKDVQAIERLLGQGDVDLY